MDFSPALDLGRSAAFHASLSSALPLSEDFPMPARCDRLPLLTASPGTSRELVVHRFGQAGARPKVYLQAALHADETPGLLVLHHLYGRSEEHTSELQSLMRISYAVFCLKKKNRPK